MIATMDHGVFLYWIPLGAGGSGFVRLNGRVWEAVQARREHCRPLDLYHTALVVRLPAGRVVVDVAPAFADALFLVFEAIESHYPEAFAEESGPESVAFSLASPSTSA